MNGSQSKICIITLVHIVYVEVTQPNSEERPLEYRSVADSSSANAR
jgi:hypothetical protein